MINRFPKQTQNEKEKKKSRKPCKEDKDNKRRASSPSDSTRVKQVDNNPPVSSKPPAPVNATSGLESVQQARLKSMPVHSSMSQPSTQQEVVQPGSTGQESFQPVSTGQALPHVQPSTSGFSDLPVTGSYRCAPEPDTFDFEHPISDTEYSDDQPDSDEGEVS